MIKTVFVLLLLLFVDDLVLQGQPKNYQAEKLLATVHASSVSDCASIVQGNGIATIYVLALGLIAGLFVAPDSVVTDQGSELSLDKIVYLRHPSHQGSQFSLK